ncbi:hypothetical protein NWE61_05845 [Mycoplasmopsis felis]|uniref:hypothetical protein n=1 Tax=Mycoplasmopsis felis TaxID=33923 RepID=UPI0021DFD70B|nr:hypothetical protein [Mycoplasmopsis felis]MCU9934595.1 hypothetical protein [Mycoplasmopsis felis]
MKTIYIHALKKKVIGINIGAIKHIKEKGISVRSRTEVFAAHEIFFLGFFI